MQNIQVNSSPLVNGDLGCLTLKRVGNLFTSWMQMAYSVKQSDIEQKLIGNSTDVGHPHDLCLFLWWTNQMNGDGFLANLKAGLYSSSYFCLSCQCKVWAMPPKKSSFCNCVKSPSLIHFQMCSVKLNCGVNIHTKWRREMSRTGSLGPSIPSLNSLYLCAMKALASRHSMSLI